MLNTKQLKYETGLFLNRSYSLFIWKHNTIQKRNETIFLLLLKSWFAEFLQESLNKKNDNLFFKRTISKSLMTTQTIIFTSFIACTADHVKHLHVTTYTHTHIIYIYIYIYI